ncbi:RagB/SusD family nutrient uptake outer membrane protein [Emticicia sp. SJ17W-69]|uniref:RagB/SusD family nutrient uptake outer membrane protein n=1 Tax=Emticicia sp. SJ17W-69 TaxID=3421657 RepID=UPI003EBE3747
MNKNIKNWLFVGTTVALMAGCDSRLDVKPTQSIDESTALATSQDVEVTLIGAYDGLSSINLYGGAVQYSGDLLGDDAEVRFGGTFATLDELWRKTMTTTNGQTQATWLQAYNTINRANNVLASLDKVEAAKKSTVEGEARFIRGLVYFDLVRLWAKAWGDGDNNTNLGVPIVTTPTRVVSEADSRSRASVAAVYTQVLEDLTKAESLLGNITDAGFASKNAAQAILARVYLQQGNYAAARDAANKVITSSQFALAPTFEEVFDDASNDGEMIFKIKVSDQDGGNDLNTFYAPSTYQGRGDIRIQAKHLALYAAGDTRGTFFVRASNNNYTAKFLDQYGDVPVVRLAEMYLIRAEANQRLSTSIGATPLDDVNIVRSRSGAKPLPLVDLNAILAERKLELSFEGLQVHDAKRLKRNVGALAFSDNKLVIPIPQREIDTNKSLVQNPGY